MQSDPIVLSYNHDHDDGTTAELEITYSRAEEAQGRSVYYAANHNVIDRNMLAFYRTLPKPNANFKGTAKSSFKFTRDIVVESMIETLTLKAPIIAEVSFSCPVGSTAAEIKDMRQRLVALLNDETVMQKLNDQLIV